MDDGSPPAKKAGPVIHSFEVEDIAELQDLARSEGWDPEFLQISAGRYSAKASGLRLADLYISLTDHGNSSVHASATRPKGVIPVLLPLSIRGSLRSLDRIVAEGDAVFLGHTEEDVLVEGGARHAGIYLPEETCEDIWRSAFGPDAEFSGLQSEKDSISGPAVKVLIDRIEFLFQGTSQTIGPRLEGNGIEGTSRFIVSQIAMALADRDELFEEALTMSVEQMVLYARRAREVMDAKQHEALSLTDLSSRVGVSIRSLQYAFQAHYGISPTRYHTLRRLNRAFNDLKQADPRETTVTQIATRWGFFHFGRFSQVYKAQFGETPSLTLATQPVRFFQSAPKAACLPSRPRPNTGRAVRGRAGLRRDAGLG